MTAKTLVVLGSGPGIGVAIASTFAERGFTHVALASRDEGRLVQDQGRVMAASRENHLDVQVRTWVCDLSNLGQLNNTLAEIESFGSLECILFNAARVGGKPPLAETVEDIERDFRLTNLALYQTARWAIPKLQHARLPSLIVTSTTLLYKEPEPQLVSLSMVKSAQRALVLSLNSLYGADVHIALLSVGGVVAPEKENLSPENIARRAWSLYQQPRGQWQREEEIHE